MYKSKHTYRKLFIVLDRAEAEQKARQAQELWLACQMLQSAINSSGNNDSSQPTEDQLKPLRPVLDAIVAAAPKDALVLSTVVSSVPEVAVSRGVWTEESLVDRFDQVHKVGRRVGFVRTADSSLFRYALSYFLSLFIFRQPVSRDLDAELSVDSLTPAALLDRAKASLEQGNLEQAVRYVNQLTGQSRCVAADWLREARLLLETKQAAEALLAFAAATTLNSLG